MSERIAVATQTCPQCALGTFAVAVVAVTVGGRLTLARRGRCCWCGHVTDTKDPR